MRPLTSLSSTSARVGNAEAVSVALIVSSAHLWRVLTVAALALALGAPAARADSLAVIRDNNVWLANPDGSGLYQVTFDGTASAPYESPSQADDGTVTAVRAVAGTRRRIYRMTQSGGLLNAP